MRTFLTLDQLYVTKAFAVRVQATNKWTTNLRQTLLLMKHNVGESVGYSDVLARRTQGACACTISDRVQINTTLDEA